MAVEKILTHHDENVAATEAAGLPPCWAPPQGGAFDGYTGGHPTNTNDRAPDGSGKVAFDLMARMGLKISLVCDDPWAGALRCRPKSC